MRSRPSYHVSSTLRKHNSFELKYSKAILLSLVYLYILESQRSCMFYNLTFHFLTSLSFYLPVLHFYDILSQQPFLSSQSFLFMKRLLFKTFLTMTGSHVPGNIHSMISCSLEEPKSLLSLPYKIFIEAKKCFFLSVFSYMI